MSLSVREFERNFKERIRKLTKEVALKYNINDIDRFPIGRGLTKENIQKIKEIYSIAEEVYPNRVDIQLRFIPNIEVRYDDRILIKKVKVNQVVLIIYFPEIKIRNTRKESFLIKDLFVKIPIRFVRDRIEFNGPLGMRTTLSLLEYKIGYLHSHLPSTLFHRADHEHRICQFQDFCTGTADINSALSLLNNNYDPDILKLVLLEVETYVSWESIQGGPHIRMNRIINSNYDYGDMTIDTMTSLYENLLDRITASPQLMKDIDWRLYKGRYEIIDNENFEQFLRTAFIRDSLINHLHLRKDEKGQYFEQSTITNEQINCFTEWFPFRNKKVFFKVEGQVKEVSQNGSPIYIHPKMKSYVKSRFEFQVNRCQARQVSIERLNSSSLV